MDIREFYHELIIDHSRNPKNFGKLDGANYHAEGVNPLCGDSYEIFLKVLRGKIVEMKFTGSGCAISKASASMMTESLKGKNISEAMDIFENFRRILGVGGTSANLPKKLRVFEGVRAFPSRVKCASLPWFAMSAAINKKKNVSTE